MPTGSQGNLRGFWRTVATELFTNVRELFEQIDAQFTGQSPEESVGAQMAVSLAKTTCFQRCTVERLPLTIR